MDVKVEVLKNGTVIFTEMIQIVTEGDLPAGAHNSLKRFRQKNPKVSLLDDGVQLRFGY